MKRSEGAPRRSIGRRASWWADAVEPVVVIVVICAVVGLLLGVVNQMTLPVALANREARERATYAALIPRAHDFTPLPSAVAGVTALVQASDGAGFAVIAQAKGYSGQVPMAVAFSEGAITRVVGMANTETPGLGTKVTAEDFTRQFIGRAAEPMSIGDIDAVTGATISSKAALAALNKAIEAYRACGAAGTVATEPEKGGA